MLKALWTLAPSSYSEKTFAVPLPTARCRPQLATAVCKPITGRLFTSNRRTRENSVTLTTTNSRAAQTRKITSITASKVVRVAKWECPHVGHSRIVHPTVGSLGVFTPSLRAGGHRKAATTTATDPHMHEPTCLLAYEMNGHH